MANNTIRLEAELRHLRNPPRADEKPHGVGTVRFVARCPFGAEEILNKVISVLEIVDEATLNGALTEEQWAFRLPEWFVSACALPMTAEQAEQWLKRWKALPSEEQTRVEIEKDWSLDNWLYWMEPENRQWFWWDAKVLDDCDHILVATEVEVWPFPWGSLRWLFKAAGAFAFEPED